MPPHHSRQHQLLVDCSSSRIGDPTYGDRLDQQTQSTSSAEDTVQVNLEKAETWWSQQPASAVDTIQKVAIMMGIPLNLLQKNFDANQLIRVLTLAIPMTN